MASADPPTNARALALRALVQRLSRRCAAWSSAPARDGAPSSATRAQALSTLRARGALSQRALGLELCVDKSNVARLCARLVEEGLATQAPDPDDGRGRLVSLTAAGRRRAATVDAASAARFEALLAALPDARQARIVDALEDLVGVLDAALDAAPDARPRTRDRRAQAAGGGPPRRTGEGSARSDRLRRANR